MKRMLSDEGGFTLIEVLASALLVVVVSLGVMSTMDATSRASDNSRARSTAQSLAQQDQERLRSMTVTDLTSVPTGPQNKVVDGRTFQVTTTAVWDGDPDPNPDCGGDPVTADYIRATSSVSWTGMRVRPVVARSLIAAPSNGTGGKIIVQVQDRNNAPAQGYTVQLSPSGVRADGTTSAKGCVAWDGIPAGNYTVTISRAGGYVDKNGRDIYSQDVTVNDNKAVSVGPISFDRAGTVVATFSTKIGAYTYVDSPAGTNTMAKTDRLTATQAGLSSQRRFGTPGSAQRSITTVNDDAHPGSPGLFPFPGAYGIYAGDCSGEDPTTYGKAIPDTAVVAPGAATNLTVRLPPVDLTITAGGPGLDTANVYFTPTDPNCGSTPIDMGATGPDPLDPSKPHGRLKFPGVPWGSYTICAEYFLSAPLGPVPAGWYSIRKPNVVVNSATGPGAITMDFYVGYTAGKCP